MNNTDTIEFLLSTTDALQRHLDQGLSFLRGVTYNEFRLLHCIQKSPQQKLTRVALASQVGLTPSAVTRALKPLEKLGYVTTQRGERDARQNLAVLTRGGEALLSDTSRAVNEMVEQLAIAQWSPKQKENLVALLSNLRESL